MKTTIIAAALAALAIPAAAQTAPFGQTGSCTQLESSVGLSGAECGTLSLQEIAEIRTAQTEL